MEMTDAPETIWMDGDIEKGDGHWSRCFETEKPCSEPALEYRRSDLQPTHAQLLADPRVKALVEALSSAVGDATWGVDHETYRNGHAALAQFKEPKE
jgi:hypothetical protein